MDVEPLVIAVGAIALILGFLAGWSLGMRKKSRRAEILDLQHRLEAAMEAKADYEAQVTEHFTTTAQLVTQMADNYRAVYHHVANGAERLCDGSVTLAPPSSADGESPEIPPEKIDVAQPLDYAPRKDDEDGQLSERFGLEKPEHPEAGMPSDSDFASEADDKPSDEDKPNP
ncbi:conserved hypothetical protein [Luminiphilus syltensis NOR5-1B]|uniref:Z-ring associated protein G n=1 Tax=Luminiphilus syltensis NOR5-1B TaxID=565045 RepID=B8KR73_9GAMM|nr:DUF1043 family protein [Luminiphilus syltensis]EED36530.1 conserved hypothetical protein [Luminiphilus syltensis NOR5-1B]